MNAPVPGTTPAVPIPSRTRFVLEHLTQDILTGRLPPGQPLVEIELARRFGVSKTPVREALKTLAGRGLVVMSEFKGTAVRAVDATMARSVYDVRLMLEPEALRRGVLACSDFPGAQEALDRADAAEDRADRSLANRDFHRALYRSCGNPLLVRMLDDLRDQAALVSVAAWESTPSWEREAKEHRRILGRAREGDASGAAHLLHDHIAGFVRRAFPQSATGESRQPDIAHRSEAAGG
ncbi:GntR family transcriptional regulator [Streptomyces sp. NPDC006385]|uniref:GntR family transcriptional regulator n=1 Tax=Streptomyces sp. NPDC006385 TaxID=3156761 RepID=UPI0033BD893F